VTYLFFKLSFIIIPIHAMQYTLLITTVWDSLSLAFSGGRPSL